MVHGSGESLCHVVSESFCSVILCAKSHFFVSNAELVCFRHRQRSGSGPGFLLDGLGAIPGSPAEVEGGFAFA